MHLILKASNDILKLLTLFLGFVPFKIPVDGCVQKYNNSNYVVFPHI